jgi:competence protein ComEC
LLIPVAALILVLVVRAQLPDGRLHVWVLDVGQGDAIMIRTPSGHTALVDGGPGATPLLTSLGRNLPFWQHHIDLVVLTHPHDDHLLGLVELADRYSIGQVVQTVFTSTFGNDARAYWLRALQVRNVPVHHPRRGDRIEFPADPDLSLQVLSPTSPEARFEWRGGDLNNTSIVLRLDYGPHSFLLSGDAQMEAEQNMALHSPHDLKSTVLKVPHHGSDTSSTPRFLDLVRPQVAVISSGEGNKYGHPAQQTLDALGSVDAQIYRTDEDGTVEFIADGERLWVRSER